VEDLCISFARTPPLIGKTIVRARIHTIGYQQRVGLDLAQALVAARIEFLIDVRAVPMSRRPDFRRARLTETLSEAGIRYVGMPGLGTPKFLRDKLARDGDYKAFFAAFHDHLASVQNHIESLARLADKKKVALMCYERDPNECHRSAVGAQVGAIIGSTVINL
jgi:uncharacterized protein (DUF488 family)